MNNDVKKFIKNEKEIAEYKLSLLRAGKEKAYTNRLISIEEEYINFPFENLSLNSLEEAREALIQFRIDRHSFNKKYSIKQKSEKISRNQILILKRKLSFLESVYKNLLENEIANVNLSKYGVSESTKEGGALAEKAKARIQIIICCLSRFIFSELKEVKTYLIDNLTRNDFLFLNKKIDTIYDRSFNEMFKFYNESINQTYDLLKSGSFENNFLPTVYPLVNIIEKYNKDNFCVSRTLPIDKSFFTKTGKPILKKSVERGFSIVTPMGRVGNETVDLLYRDIYSDSEICLNEIMEYYFYNVKIQDGTYNKAIPTLPVWDMVLKKDDPYLTRQLFSLFGLSNSSLNIADLKDKSFVEAINNSNSIINLSLEKSKILVAATRSEADKIADAKKYINLLIKDLKEEYKSKFLSSKIEVDNNLRKDKIKRIVGSIAK